MKAQIRDMESNQLLLYHRFSEVADNKISGIESSLSITGLDIDLMLRQTKGSRGGEGGPFLPVDRARKTRRRCRSSLDGLNARMDRTQPASQPAHYQACRSTRR